MGLIDELKEEMTKYSIRAYERKLTCAAGGNVSARIGDTNEFLITASGISIGDTDPDNIITVNPDGTKIDGPVGLIPSKETGMHLAAYEQFPEAMAVFHMHPLYANCWSAQGKAVPRATVTARFKLGDTPFVPPAGSGSDELHESVKACLAGVKEGTHTILLQRHGCITWGSSIVDAFLKVDLVEEQAMTAYFMNNAGVSVDF